MTKLWTAALLVAATVGTAGIASAHNNDPNSPVGQCIQDAVQTKQSCMQVCRDDFQASVDTCRNVNHTCAEQARQDRQTCVQGVLTSLQQCIAQNCATPQPAPQGATGHWEGQGGDGQGECNGDDDGFDNFQCREQCRQSVDVLDGLKACRDAFRTAIAQCALPTPTPSAAKR
jgi:hypothetical protein